MNNRQIAIYAIVFGIVASLVTFSIGNIPASGMGINGHYWNYNNILSTFAIAALLFASWMKVLNIRQWIFFKNKNNEVIAKITFVAIISYISIFPVAVALTVLYWMVRSLLGYPNN